MSDRAAAPRRTVRTDYLARVEGEGATYIELDGDDVMVLADDERRRGAPLRPARRGAQVVCEQAIRNYDPCVSCATHFPDLTVERR